VGDTDGDFRPGSLNAQMGDLLPPDTYLFFLLEDNKETVAEHFR